MASAIPTVPPGEQSRPAFVYVITGPPDAVKVGFATDTRRRCIALQTASPHKLAVAYQLPVLENDAPAVEAHAHWLLRDHQVKGEWFGVAVTAAASAIRRAERAVRKGSARQERAGETDPARPYGDGALAALFVSGALDEVQLHAARAYRRGLGWAMTDASRNIRDHRHEAELIIDAKRWIERTSADVAGRLGAEALGVLQSVALKGHRLRSQDLGQINGTRTLRLLRQALGIVAEHAAAAPWALR